MRADPFQIGSSGYFIVNRGDTFTFYNVLEEHREELSVLFDFSSLGLGSGTFTVLWFNDDLITVASSSVKEVRCHKGLLAFFLQ